MFYLTLTVEAPCKSYPAQCLASFTCSQDSWGLWEKELPFCASLCLEKREKKHLGNNSLSPTGTMCSSSAVWPCQMGMVLFVLEFQPSHPKTLSFGWIFRWDKQPLLLWRTLPQLLSARKSRNFLFKETHLPNLYCQAAGRGFCFAFSEGKLSVIEWVSGIKGKGGQAPFVPNLLCFLQSDSAALVNNHINIY